jgi:hypothetical protein
MRTNAKFSSRRRATDLQILRHTKRHMEELLMNINHTRKVLSFVKRVPRTIEFQLCFQSRLYLFRAKIVYVLSIAKSQNQ